MATDIVQPQLAGEGLDDFLELESKIQRVAEALRATRAERDRAHKELVPLQAAHDKLQRALAQAEQELVTLRKERQEVRQRVARLTQQLEAADA
jgi:chromosome segregation ATPase